MLYNIDPSAEFMFLGAGTISGISQLLGSSINTKLAKAHDSCFIAQSVQDMTATMAGLAPWFGFSLFAEPISYQSK